MRLVKEVEKRENLISEDIFLLLLEMNDWLHDAVSHKHSEMRSAPGPANALFHLISVLCKYRSYKGVW